MHQPPFLETEHNPLLTCHGCEFRNNWWTRTLIIIIKLWPCHCSVCEIHYGPRCPNPPWPHQQWWEFRNNWCTRTNIIITKLWPRHFSIHEIHHGPRFPNPPLPHQQWANCDPLVRKNPCLTAIALKGKLKWPPPNPTSLAIAVFIRALEPFSRFLGFSHNMY